MKQIAASKPSSTMMASLSLRGARQLWRTRSTPSSLTSGLPARGMVAFSARRTDELWTYGPPLGSTNSSSQHRWVSRTRTVSRKGAKMGRHLQSLEEQAHRKEHEEAVELRKAKKSRKKANRHVDDEGDDEVEHVVASGGMSEDDVVQEVQFDADDDKFSSHDNEDEDAVPSLPDPNDVRARMMKVVSSIQKSFQSIRGNEPTPDLFEQIRVEAYGERTPLSNVAQVVIVSPTLVTVTCFDPSLAKEVRNAIRDAPQFDGAFNPLLEEDGLVKVPVPRPSAETRQNTVKQLKHQTEAGRQRLRKIRRAALEVVKQAKDGKLDGISKDDAFRVGKDIDHVTEDVTNVLNDELKKKEQSVMAV